jgi:hypothetical protein
LRPRGCRRSRHAGPRRPRPGTGTCIVVGLAVVPRSLHLAATLRAADPSQQDVGVAPSATPSPTGSWDAARDQARPAPGTRQPRSNGWDSGTTWSVWPTGATSGATAYDAGPRRRDGSDWSRAAGRTLGQGLRCGDAGRCRRVVRRYRGAAGPGAPVRRGAVDSTTYRTFRHQLDPATAAGLW